MIYFTKTNYYFSSRVTFFLLSFYVSVKLTGQYVLLRAEVVQVALHLHKILLCCENPPCFPSVYQATVGVLWTLGSFQLYHKMLLSSSLPITGAILSLQAGWQRCSWSGLSSHSARWSRTGGSQATLCLLWWFCKVKDWWSLFQSLCWSDYWLKGEIKYVNSTVLFMCENNRHKSD